MKVELLEQKKDSFSIKFKVTDTNSGLVNSFRQIAYRSIPIYHFEVIKYISNDSEYQNEILGEEIGKLHLVQTSIDKTNAKSAFTLKVSGFSDDYRPVYAHDIKCNDDPDETEGYWTHKNILLCTLKKGQSLNLELKLVKGTKHETSNTGFMCISEMGHPDPNDSTIFSGILLGNLEFNQIKKEVFKILNSELSEFTAEMKKIKEESEYGKGVMFKTSRYDYLILEIVNQEIHDLYPDIGFCAYFKEFSSFPETKFVVYDEKGKEMDIIKTAVDTVLKRLL